MTRTRRKALPTTGRISTTGWITEELKMRMQGFLEHYPTIRSESVLIAAALADYLDNAEKFGIDINYKPKRNERDRHS